MKIGTHANEELADIIARKKREIEEAGLAMWGYGGNSCHPTTMVQPFAKTHRELDQTILLCMQPMESRHFAEPVLAAEFSIDGVNWQPMPSGVNVLGSRYALCIRQLREVDASLSLEHTRVAIGNSKGRPGSEYVKGHVDKACLEVVASGESATSAHIGLVAEMVDPFAVFLRN